MKKSRIAFVVSIIFALFFSSSFDFPRFQKQKRDRTRMHRYRSLPTNNKQPFQAGETEYAPGHILVKFEPTVSTQTIGIALDAYQAKTIKHIPELDIYLMEVPPNSTVEETVYALSLNPDVAHVSPDYKTYITAVPSPSDSLFDRQYYLYNRGQVIAQPNIQGTAGADIRALVGWEETKGDEQVVIAVIDTGIDFDHPDLANTDELEKISSHGYDFANDDNDPTDDNGHGTFVSGLIAAKSNNGEGIAGVTWYSKILPLKAVGSDGTGYVSWLVDAIVHAVDNGANVISLSLGFPLGPNEEVPSLEEALAYAHERGIVSVASAGNENTSVLYPAAYDEYCIAVAATDYNDSRPSWSNFGPEVDVAAPGTIIWGPVPSWWPGSVWQDFTLDPYGYGNGTSASAAIVSGFVALIKSVKPWLEPDEIMNVIRYSADDVNASEYPGKDEFLGYGRINMDKGLVPIKLTK